MSKYTYRAVCYVDVIADTEEEAIDKAEEMFPYEIDVNQLTLYECERLSRDEMLADQINDERKLGI